METNYKTLSEFLAGLNFTEQRLKQLTGISIGRLRAIYKVGDVTKEEMLSLLKALTAPQAAAMVCASQIGSFNQNGIGNQQTIINNYFITVMRRLGIVIDLPQPHTLPALPAQVSPVLQQPVTSQLPGGQVAAVGGMALVI